MEALTRETTHYEEEIKRSRFIARARLADAPEAALAFIASERESRANHNCWAFKIGQEYRFSDDGEPGGTAGRPILGAIERQGLDRAVVLVTRYFGGIKLGAGGLARAYGGVAAKCLHLAPRVIVRPMTSLLIEAPFEEIGSVYHVLERWAIQKEKEEYAGDGLRLWVTLEKERLPELRRVLNEKCRGKIALRILA